jgi:molybdopterin-guanine dinucleotide biosynthesis protein A
MTYDAIVLAGGRGRRLGGINKPAIAIGGRRMLDIAVDAVAGAERTVVVGSELPTHRPVERVFEEPAGGGPVAGIAAAAPLLHAMTVVVLAADLPFITPAAVGELVAGRGDAVAAIAVDILGQDQPLVACYDLASLRDALPIDPQGASMRSLLKELAAAGRLERVTLDGDPPVTWDLDTAADLNRAREQA